MTATGASPANAPERTARDELSVLSRAEMQELQVRRDDVPLVHFGVSVAIVIAVPLVFALSPTAWTAVLCVMLHLHVYHRFAQIVHGSDHSALFRDARWNVVIGRLAGYFLGYSREGHRATHNEHHMYLNTERDADLIWCDPQAKVGAIFSGWVRDVFLVSAFRRFVQYMSGAGEPARPVQPEGGAAHGARTLSLESFLSLAPALVVQLVLIGIYGLTAGVQYYFLLYALPIITLYPAQIRLRSNVEHAFDPGFRPQTGEDRRVVRSVKANWLERFLMAPIYVDYHYEHHLLPNMPYYNAPRLRQLLAGKGVDVPIARGYLAFIWRKWRAERALARAAAHA